LTGSNTLTLTVESAGVIAVPVASSAIVVSAVNRACSLTIYDSAAATAMAETTATVATDGTCTCTVSATLAASDQWSCRWKWGDSATTCILEDREVIVCRRAPRCPIGPSDLERRLSATRGDWELPAGKTWSSYIDEAWDGTVARVIASGIGAHKIVSWYGLREYVLRSTEAGIARDLMTTRSGATKWAVLFDGLMAPADDPRSCEWAWSKSGFRTDRDQNGIPDAGSESESKPGSFQQSTDEPGWRGF
jgi:hypothetical protein